jgi:hypothetical protein
MGQDISKSLPQLMSQWNIDRIWVTYFVIKVYSQLIYYTTHKSLILHGFNSVLQPRGLSMKRLDHLHNFSHSNLTTLWKIETLLSFPLPFKLWMHHTPFIWYDWENFKDFSRALKLCNCSPWKTDHKDTACQSYRLAHTFIKTPNLTCWGLLSNSIYRRKECDCY